MNELRPLEEVLAGVDKECQDRIACVIRQHREKIEAIKQNRELASKLLEAGIELNLAKHDDLDSLQVELGEMPTAKRKKKEFGDKLRTLRKVFGHPLKLDYKHLHDHRKKLIRMYLKVENMPNVCVMYTTKLPKDAKCKVVKKKVRYTEHQLVCSV